MQGVIISFDPTNAIGTIMVDTPDRSKYPLAQGSLDSSIFKTVRQGQRVNFDLNDENHAVNIRIGSEVDMGISTARV